jgi:hypothetical protein
VAVSREHRRAKTDRLDTKGLKRVFLGWLPNIEKARLAQLRRAPKAGPNLMVLAG